MNPIHLVLQLLKNAASVVIALQVLFEEWGREPLKKRLAWVLRLPVKLLALWLMARGMVLAGGLAECSSGACVTVDNVGTQARE